MKKFFVISLFAFMLGVGGVFILQTRAPAPLIKPVVEGETSCAVDRDCQLVLREHLSQCCAAGDRCGRLDYSQSNWIAVNVEWFAGKRQEICPKEKEYQECGPAPGCAVELDRRYRARCMSNRCEKIRAASEGTVPSGQGFIWAPKPEELSTYPDLPLGNLDLSKPLSIKVVVEHRMALNGKTISVRGYVVSTLLGEAECGGSGACAQPRIVLADTTKAARDINYDLTVLLNETDQGYSVGHRNSKRNGFGHFRGGGIT